MNILMVCLGNICRSPLAEGILQFKLSRLSADRGERKKSKKHVVDSAGTAAYHVGELPDKRSIAVAKKYGIDLTTQRARKFTEADFDAFDLIFAMDASNYQNILNLATTENHRQKVHLILDELQLSTHKEVPDPYYGGEQGFENVFQLLDKSCGVIATKIDTL
ncbi:MAG: low molecular weight phosphotyrosine protein phosphatase [Polaribacter sp.]|nr:low molecular weight phosphotyrosine protein phosphatase [Polaribacter sp.]